MPCLDGAGLGRVGRQLAAFACAITVVLVAGGLLTPGCAVARAETVTHAAMPPDGSFVSYVGYVYRIAGGAPLYVSSWAPFGGPQPTTTLTAAQFAALNPVPTNGTLVGDTATGMVYEIAGGAPLYVSSWAAIGGPRATVNIDHWDIANITNPLAHMNAVPADGTFVGDTATGMVYELAGGAPLYVSSWAAVGGGHPTTSIDDWDIANITNPAAHMNAVPADGTFVGDTATGMVYELAGGAPLYVSNWAAVGGGHPTTSIDDWDIANITNPAAHMNAVPADGTFIGTSAGAIYRIAGGAPFAVTSWAPLGGPQPYVIVDQWDISNRTNPAAHLAVAPVDGTVVRGLPSGAYWDFKSSYRYPTTSAPAAVGVDDSGLGAFAPVPVPACANLSLRTSDNGGGVPGAMSCSSLPGMGLTYRVVSTPTHGTLLAVNTTTGSFVYDSAPGYIGSDSFTYQAANLGGTSSLATATIAVPPDPPACSSIFTSVPEGSRAVAIQLPCLGSAGVPISFGIVQGPSHGTLTRQGGGDVQYTPHTGYQGSDSFTYQATNAGGASSVATATIDVIASTVVVRRRAILEPFLNSTLLYYPRFTVFEDIGIDDLTGPAQVRVSCSGAGCPFRSRLASAGPATKCKSARTRCRRHGRPRTSLSLLPLVRGRHLRAGSRLTIVILEPGLLRKTYTITVRRNRYPLIQTRCASAGATGVPPAC